MAILVVFISGCTTSIEVPSGADIIKDSDNLALKQHRNTLPCDPDKCDTAPSLIHATAPTYPSEALWEGRSGVAIVIFDIEATGETSNVRLESASHLDFGESAVDAVEEWQFSPAMLDGKNVKYGAARQPINFSNEP